MAVIATPKRQSKAKDELVSGMKKSMVKAAKAKPMVKKSNANVELSAGAGYESDSSRTLSDHGQLPPGYKPVGKAKAAPMKRPCMAWAAANEKAVKAAPKKGLVKVKPVGRAKAAPKKVMVKVKPVGGAKAAPKKVMVKAAHKKKAARKKLLVNAAGKKVMTKKKCKPCEMCGCTTKGENIQHWAPGVKTVYCDSCAAGTTSCSSSSPSTPPPTMVSPTIGSSSPSEDSP